MARQPLPHSPSDQEMIKPGHEQNRSHGNNCGRMAILKNPRPASRTCATHVTSVDLNGKHSRTRSPKHRKQHRRRIVDRRKHPQEILAAPGLSPRHHHPFVDAIGCNPKASCPTEPHQALPLEKSPIENTSPGATYTGKDNVLVRRKMREQQMQPGNAHGKMQIRISLYRLSGNFSFCRGGGGI